MNPLSVVPLLVYTLAATLWPAQVDSRRRGASLLLVEAVIVAAAVVAGGYLAELVVPRSQGLWWGRVGLLATGYLYVCGRGRSRSPPPCGPRRAASAAWGAPAPLGR